MGKIEELLVNKGLYDSVDITVDDLDEIEKCLTKDEYAGNTIDCFCVHCATNRVFEYTNSEVHEDTGIMRMSVFDDGNPKVRRPKREEQFRRYLNKRYAMTYRCTRDRQHFIIFDLITTDDKIIKVGQYPSVADLVIPEIAKYKPVLGTQYREFSKAIGLFAHGIGIGSFVYLRRIIENLVFDKYNEVSENLEISNTEFMRLKFDEKIEALKPYLPEVLVANKNIYGIVSKGIHELSEEECREMFPYIKAGIELILDSLLAEKERKSKEKIFEKFVAKKTGELK
ncbi:hypothetical protein [Hominenteromicrobium sp.]|jgi:hypothetical protein|uniref:hypothetical protein n=1 Tax=Hominenteromicrobium sp. TaxID=3073581 RepID=UPI00399A2C9C